jgi:hypothetical protein
VRQPNSRFFFDEPGSYRIRAHGYLDPRRSDMLGGMAISVRRFTGKPPVTAFTGELQDQAALMGGVCLDFGARARFA